MPIFEFSFHVESPLEKVLDFHRDTTALKMLTPPPILVQLHRVEPLAEGSVSEFTLWMGALPLHWRAVHRDVGEDGFTDVQVTGPMKKWEHRHHFSSVADSNQTRIDEKVEFEHLAGPRGWLTRLLFAQPALYALFAYRKWRTIRYCQQRHRR